MEAVKHIFLIRHGNAFDENWKQTDDSSLNPTGEKHAEALARRFAGLKVAKVYSSTMERAKDTCAHFLRARPDLVAEYRDDLREVAVRDFSSEADKFAFIKENFEPLCKQVALTLDLLVESAPRGNTFVFTHGHWIRFAALNLLHGDVHGFFNMNIEFASVSVLQVLENGHVKLAILDDCSHTEGLPYGGSPWVEEA